MKLTAKNMRVVEKCKRWQELNEEKKEAWDKLNADSQNYFLELEWLEIQRDQNRIEALITELTGQDFRKVLSKNYIA